MLHYKVTLKLGHNINAAFWEGHFWGSFSLNSGPELVDFLLTVKERKHWNYQDTWSHLKILSVASTGCMTFVKF